jgi:hypothetical protein
MLWIVLIDTVEERSAVKGIARIKSGPEAVAKRTADVSFESG